ncbi:MAG: hypothetical protein GXP25_07980 [Planctomycetes bacterium]|nr:hypothetical protein [Planctomycetota bacterium]
MRKFALSRILQILAFLSALAALATCATAQTEKARALEKIRKHIKPLTHPLGDRLPIITWQNRNLPLGMEAGNIEENQKVFVDRGFLPTCNACVNPEKAKLYVPIFKFWQSQGFPVCILPQGWVQTLYTTARNGRYKCPHQPPAEQSEHYPCPALMMTHKRIPSAAARTADTLRALKENGIKLKLLLVDFESGAYLRNAADREENVRKQMEMAAQCPRCIETFGKEALSTLDGYVGVVNKARASATKQALCDPARSVFPDLFIGNYYAWPINRVPRPEGRWPAYGYEGSGLNVLMPRVYMNAGWGGAGRDQDKMNWNAFFCCLEGFSPAASVRREGELLIPWPHVWLGGSYLKFVMKGRKLPEPWVMSEMARHMMLRGAETFAIWVDAQIGEFPADYPYPEYAEMGQFCYDVKGVQEGFSDMLRFNSFLRKAKPMNFEVPGARSQLGAETATWSGVQTPEKALVRTISFNQGKIVEKKIEAYGKSIPLTFGPKGQFYWVYPDGRAEKIEGE